LSASLANRRSTRKGFALAAACLLTVACDHTSPATVGQPGTAPGESEKAHTIAAPPSVDRPAATASHPTTSPAAAQKSSEPPRQAPDQHAPVKVTLRTDKTTVRDGESLTVTVDVQIAPGWHIYAIDRPTGLSLPTKIKLQLPAGLESTGDWKTPEPALDDSSAGEPAFVYHGTAAFKQTLRVKQGTPAGPLAIPVEFRYQVCDRFSCRAPTALKLQTSIQVVP
jgi:DsbC/DsbD-like thiol-disulfide interchange protein